MYKYITILGAAGQIAQRLTATLSNIYRYAHHIIWTSIEHTHSSRNFRTRTGNCYEGPFKILKN